MVQKTMKKAPAKKAVASKAPAKKTVVKAAPAKKTVVKAAPAKKTVVKAAPAVKKAAVKKIVAKKPVVKAAPAQEIKPVMAAPEACSAGCDCGCGCKKSGRFCRFVKKLVIFLVIFALGFAAAKFCTHGKYGFHKGPRMPDIFVNGCLDVAKIRCPEMAQKVATADVNLDGCISRDEFYTMKKEMRKDCGADKPCGCDND